MLQGKYIHMTIIGRKGHNITMRVPVYQELKITKFDVMNVLDQMKKSRIGQAPCYIDISPLEKDEAEHALQVIEDTFKMLKASPLFPYPTYIITEIPELETNLPTIETKDKLPKHFMRPIKRLTSKELSLLNKAVTLTNRIANTPIQQRLQELQQGTKYYKMLFQLSKELDFYQDVLEDLKKQTNNKGRYESK